MAPSEKGMSKQTRSYSLPLSQARAKVPGPEGERSVSLFRHGTLEVKLSSPVAPNVQTPHVQDELYIVAEGHGYLWHDSQRDSCGPGDLLFVAAGTEHHFEDFSPDFAVWILFYGPHGGEVPCLTTR